MTKQTPDYSLERDGIGLRDWLWRLVAEDPQVRAAAGEALQAMQYGIPSIHTDWADLEPMPDCAAQRTRFEQAVRLTVGGSDFDTSDFVGKLVAYLLALTDDWRQRVAQRVDRDSNRDERFDRLAGQLVEKINASTAASEKVIAGERLARLIAIYACGACDDENDPCRNAESLLPAGIGAAQVFSILSRELLASPDALQLMLDESEVRHDALEALMRIGPSAVTFAPQLIQQIEELPDCTEERHVCFDGAKALGSIGRSDPSSVAAIIRLLGSECSSHRLAAAETVEHLGTDVCGREEEIIALLEPMIERDDEYFAALPAMASVGRHLSPVRLRVIRLAEPRPPKWRAVSWSDEKCDATMFERAVAISAMRYFVDCADECVPVLVRAMDTFEEFDPDETYDGPLGRISSILASFGSKAASAAVPLASHLLDDPDELPKSILVALAEMGPAAIDALPFLRTFRETYVPDEPWEDLDITLVDRYEDIIGWTVQRIRGQQ